MNLLLLFAGSKDSSSTPSFWLESAAALSRGENVSVYLLHEGAAVLHDPRLSSLLQQGLRLFACPRAVELFAPSAQVEVTLGGPGLLAELIDRSAVLHSFNP